MIGTHTIVGQEKAIELIGLAAELNEAALLIGETGTGKTTIIKNVADKHGREWVRFNLTGDTTVDEFVGKYTLQGGETVWQDGVLLTAMRQGKWLICDEINAALPEILFVLHSLLDDDRSVMLVNHDGQVVHPHEDFRFFATMNPVDEYAGTKELNKAFKSRFAFIIQVKTPDNTTEAKLVSNRSNVKLPDAKKMVMVATKLRSMKKKREIYLTVSTRDVLQWAKIAGHTDVATSFEATILNKCDDEEERQVIIQAVKSILADLSELEEQVGKENSLDLEALKDQGMKLMKLKNDIQAMAGASGSAHKTPAGVEAKERLAQIMQAKDLQELHKIGQDMGLSSLDVDVEVGNGTVTKKPVRGSVLKASQARADLQQEHTVYEAVDPAGAGEAECDPFDFVDPPNPTPPNKVTGQKFNIAVVE
jgi:midasin (ATPase involved in ribosome maturation)